jgi:hypothetical protein
LRSFTDRPRAPAVAPSPVDLVPGVPVGFFEGGLVMAGF